MADNFPATPGTGRNVATDQVTYSGDVADVQLFRLVDVTGAEGSKTVTALTLPISGTVTANAGSGTFTTQAGVTVRVSANFTRPADTTAYAVGDTVANSTTAGSVTPLTFSSVVRTAGGGGMVRRAKLRTSSTSVTNAQFRLHLFAATQTSAAGDNAALSLPGVADYLGAFDITVDQAFTDGASGIGTPRAGGEINLDIPSVGTTIYGFLEARAAYTPTSAEVFTVELEILQD